MGRLFWRPLFPIPKIRHNPVSSRFMNPHFPAMFVSEDLDLCGQLRGGKAPARVEDVAENAAGVVSR